MTTDAIRFFWNGLKVEGSKKLIPCYLRYYAAGERRPDTLPACVSVSARGYENLPQVVRDAFQITNNTDLMTDLFDHDRFKVTAESPYWATALAAATVEIERTIKRIAGRLARCDSSYLRGELAHEEKRLAALRAELAAATAKEAA